MNAARTQAKALRATPVPPKAEVGEAAAVGFALV
jgi:hypothetical protein